MSTNPETMDGGCQCGAIRYRTAGQPVLTEYCHCKSCRDSVGAPMVAWAAFLHGKFQMMDGNPTQYHSSETVIRTFCGKCGTSLTLADTRFPEEIYVSLASFDQPEMLPPQFHIWRSHRLTWLETSDALPRYVQFKADGILEE